MLRPLLKSTLLHGQGHIAVFSLTSSLRTFRSNVDVQDGKTFLLSHRSPDCHTWLLEGAEEALGFCSTGPSRDGDHDAGLAGEVYAIYLRPEAWGRGAGRAIFNHSVEDFRQRGFTRVTLWVVIANERARRFYEAAGFRADGLTKTGEFEDGGRKFTLEEMQMIRSLTSG